MKFEFKYNFLIMVFLLLTAEICSQNTAPIVSNVDHSYNSGTGIITITYNVTDSQENIVSILMEVSDDGGQTYNYACTQVSGDVGENVNTGIGRTIIWQHDAEHGDPPSGNNFIVKIVADDLYGDQIYYAGQIYNTVTIGTQTWLKENLNVGTMINSTASGFQQTDNGIIEKYCYNNNPSHCDNYGGLYEWTEALQYVLTPGTRGICPEGWHIPTLAEFETLCSFVGDNSNALKEVGQGSGGGAGTNTSGFSALLAGYRSRSNSFTYLDDITFFWSSTPCFDLFAYLIYLEDGNSTIYRPDHYRDFGLSVRCIKD